jgi:hypothetical protein
MVHAPSWSVTPTVPQDYVAQLDAPLFPQPSVHVCQQVRCNFSICRRYFSDLRQHQHSTAVNSQCKAILARKFTSYHNILRQRRFLNVESLNSMRPCLPSQRTMSGEMYVDTCRGCLSHGMAYTNTNIDFPSTRRPRPPPRSLKDSLAHPNYNAHRPKPIYVPLLQKKI